MAKKKTNGNGFIVMKLFRCVHNWDKQYQPGDDVSDLEESRLDSLVEKGLVSPGSAQKAAEEAEKAEQKAKEDAEKKAAEEAEKAEQKAKEDAEKKAAEEAKKAEIDQK